MYKTISKILLLLLSLNILFSCKTKQETKQPVEMGLREMGELATTEYEITKIVQANDDKTWYKFGDRKILISCTGYIKAGIDLSGITLDNAKIDGDNITLTVPPVKLISLNIPPEKILVEKEETGFFRDKFNNAEQNDIMVQAQKQIQHVADSLGVLNIAQKNTELFLNDYLRSMGYKKINILFNK